MQALVMEINEDGIDLLEDAINRAVMEIKEAKRSTMADFALEICDAQHIRQIQNVSVKMYTIDPIRNIAGKIGEIGIPDIFLDLDILEWKLRYFSINTLTSTFFAPTANRQPIYLPPPLYLPRSVVLATAPTSRKGTWQAAALQDGAYYATGGKAFLLGTGDPRP